MEKLQHPLKNVTPSFLATPSKSWGLVKPPTPFGKFGPAQQKREKVGGAHYVHGIEE